jgi:hypothetical protein
LTFFDWTFLTTFPQTKFSQPRKKEKDENEGLESINTTGKGTGLDPESETRNLNLELATGMSNVI